VQLSCLVGGDACSDADDREHGDGHVDQQQDLPGGDRQHEATRRRTDREPDQTHRGDEGDRTDPQAVVGEQPEGQR